MDTVSVRSEKLGDITIVTLERPQVRNAVDAETARLLHRAFLEFEADAGARVAVFHGAHGHFCAGWDLQAGAQLAAGGAAAVIGALDFDPQDAHPPGPMGPTRLVRVVPRGGARDAAIALAQQVAKFPQATMLADRKNAYEQWGKGLPEALHAEWERSRQRIADGLEGAGRFAGGEGRHGKF